MTIISEFTTNAMTSDFLIVNFPWLSGDVPRNPSYGIYILQLVRFARCCTSVFDYHSNKSKLLQNCWQRDKDITSFGNIGKVLYIILRTSVDIWWYLVPRICVKRNISPGLLRWSSLSIGGSKTQHNFISSGSIIVKPLRRRQYDPLVIDKTIGLVLGLSTALYRPFLKHCTLTNKAVGTILRALSKPPRRR